MEGGEGVQVGCIEDGTDTGGVSIGVLVGERLHTMY